MGFRVPSLCLFLLLACGQARDADPRPDVLLISLDSVRRDALGCYGGRFKGRSPTPNLDRLAKYGIRFENAYSTTSWTLPAHATLFAGVPELVHGLEQDGVRLDEGLATLPERLAAAGYRTAGVYSGPYLDPRYGFGRGFERYRAGYGPELAAAMGAMSEAHGRLQQLDKAVSANRRIEALDALSRAEHQLEVASHRDSSSRVVTDLALEELGDASEDERPLFLFVHYFDAHYDYMPPPSHRRKEDRGTTIASDFVRYLADPGSLRGGAELQSLKELQSGEVAWIDSQIGRLLEEIDRSGRLDDTLVVVLSDHGDEFLEHGGFGHRRTLYEEVTRVPMLLSWPNGLPRGEKMAQLVTLADVAGSVLALVDTESGEAPLLAQEERGVLGRLVLSPTGEREDVRVIDSFLWRGIKILRERPLGRGASLRWIDLGEWRDERAIAWSADFRSPDASAALEAFISEYERQLAQRRAPPIAATAEDLLAALRGLGYAGEEARAGALEDDGLVRPTPAQIERQR